MNRNPRSTASFRLTIGPGQRLLRAAGAPGPRIDGAQTVGWQIAGQQEHALAGAAAGHRGADSLVFTHGGLVFLSSLAASLHSSNGSDPSTSTSPLSTRWACWRSNSPSQMATTMVATPLPTRLVSAGISLMKRSTPSSKVMPATGTVPSEESVAASVMKPPPVTAAAPLEVSMSTINMVNSWLPVRCVLVVAGSEGKTGAAAMAGLAALRAGAGLVTVASTAGAIPQIASHAPELMTAPFEGTGLEHLAEGKTVIAMGPGLGRSSEVETLVGAAVQQFGQPMVLDADALVPQAFPLVPSSAGVLAAGDRTGGKAADASGSTQDTGGKTAGATSATRVLTPHPGEMSRLTGKPTAEIQEDRVRAARAFATERQVTLVLKGQRTVIAFPDGRVWINPTGTPAMGKGGSGDILTGLIAGFLAQFPQDPDRAVAAAVYLHGLAGEIGAQALGEKCLIATDLLRYLPQALRFQRWGRRFRLPRPLAGDSDSRL